MPASLRSSRPTPAYISGSSTLRQAVIDGSRLNCWKTKPTRPVADLGQLGLVIAADVLAGQQILAARTARRGSR